MRILISNDDGYLAPGIIALAEALAPIAEIIVVAPDSNRSASSNSLTLERPLFVIRAQEGVYHVNGTPSDCVHIAMTGLLPWKPDLVVSGINQGQNMGDDTLYSGTIAAATEGYLFGVSSFAFSQVEKGWAEIKSAARVARELVEREAGGGVERRLGDQRERAARLAHAALAGEIAHADLQLEHRAGATQRADEHLRLPVQRNRAAERR